MRLYGLDRIILVLALLLATLLGLLWLTGPKNPPLTALSPDEVNEIRVLKEGKLELGLLRDREGWMLTHPDIERAAAQRVAGLLDLLQTPSQASWPASPDTLGHGGLAQPRRTLQFDTLEIDFGSSSTPPGQRYVRVGDHVHLIDEVWFHISGLPASYYRRTD